MNAIVKIRTPEAERMAWVEYYYLKPILEIVILCIAFPVLIALTPLVAFAIMVESKFKGPIFFRQQRVGLEGNLFTIIKFRTMAVNAEKNGEKFTSKNDPRITRVGRFLRKTRIDELPQLWNVLRREMAIIGPRPEQPQFAKELEKINRHYGERHNVKPGITGLAQVKYGYADTLEANAREKLRFDLKYIRNYSILIDLYVTACTFAVIFRMKGQ